MTEISKGLPEQPKKATQGEKLTPRDQLGIFMLFREIKSATVDLVAQGEDPKAINEDLLVRRNRLRALIRKSNGEHSPEM